GECPSPCRPQHHTLGQAVLILKCRRGEITQKQLQHGSLFYTIFNSHLFSLCVSVCVCVCVCVCVLSVLCGRSVHRGESVCAALMACVLCSFWWISVDTTSVLSRTRPR